MIQALINFTGINAIFQSLLLSLFFWINKRGFRISNRILAMSLLAFGLLIFGTMPGASYQFQHYYKLAFVLRRAAFLIAPLFYFYIKSITDKRFQFRLIDSLHFIPFMATLIFSLYQGFVEGIWYITFTEEYYLHTSAIVIHNLIYLWFANRHLKKSGFSIKQLIQESDYAHHKLLKFIIIGFSVFWLVNFQNLFIFKVLKIYSWCPYGGSVYCLIPFLFLNILALSVLIKPDLVTKYKNGIDLLGQPRQDRYHQKLTNLMENRKLYLNPDLSMHDLSEELSISVKHLSCLINQSFHVNFYDFINQYRIEDSKKLLRESLQSKTTILEIAYQTGFNSKSTFNSAFKKMTGMTPSEFRKSEQRKLLMKVAI